MTSVCIYFQVHQPMRLREFSIFGRHSGKIYERYFDEKLNRMVFEKVAGKCYLRTNRLLLDLIRKYEGKFKISYSITGVFLDQCKAFGPEVLESFQKLAETGQVDFLSETYYHSLSSLFSNKNEFHEQVEMHADEIKGLFGVKPRVFRNTEALFSNEIASLAERMGFGGIITEGFESILGWRSPNYLYRVNGSKIKVLLRNYRLSDDVAYRFSARWWSEYPLTADKYARWLSKCEGDCVNLFMDYETFGEHQWEDTGIFEFVRHLPAEVLKYKNLDFKTPKELLELNPVGDINVPYPISWADMERDTSAWLGNKMQKECFRTMEELEGKVKNAGNSGKNMVRVWRLLQNSDHLYYLCTKCLADGDVHKYFSHYSNPYEGFINYMNILQDFKERVR